MEGAVSCLILLIRITLAFNQQIDQFLSLLDYGMYQSRTMMRIDFIDSLGKKTEAPLQLTGVRAEHGI
jgi:hypothetical protein